MSGRIVIKSQLSGNQLPFASAPIRARLFYPPSKFFDVYVISVGRVGSFATSNVGVDEMIPYQSKREPTMTI
uniref:Uncharacterized protein n=1 Tax=Cucumis melo TaxID=3656 RepID=A0A9I9EHH3_CUCME